LKSVEVRYKQHFSESFRKKLENLKNPLSEAFNISIAIVY